MNNRWAVTHIHECVSTSYSRPPEYNSTYKSRSPTTACRPSVPVRSGQDRDRALRLPGARDVEGLHHVGRHAQPLPDVLGAARPIPSPFHRLQTGLVAHPARSQRRAVLFTRDERESLSNRSPSPPCLAVASHHALSRRAVCRACFRTRTWTPSTSPWVGVNKKKFKPPVASIKERYYAMFRGKGGEL